MRVDLTDEQAKQLAPLFEIVENAHGIGLTGMLVAQVAKDSRGIPFMHVGFVHHARAKELVAQATAYTPEAQ
jgi:hypothetical protein